MSTEKLIELIGDMVPPNKILIFGNGGLAAESCHFTAEMVGQYAYPVYIPCISLTSNSSLLTALANDLGYENVFSHQVDVLGNQGDILIGMTTSQSPNIVKALSIGKFNGLWTVAICSEKSEIDADIVLRVPGSNVAEIQEEIIKLLHYIAREAKGL